MLPERRKNSKAAHKAAKLDRQVRAKLDRRQVRADLVTSARGPRSEVPVTLICLQSTVCRDSTTQRSSVAIT
jgi:hypothetical protein